MEEMIYKYIRRKLNDLLLTQEIKTLASELIDSLSKKNIDPSQIMPSKGKIFTKVCLKLLKIAETIFEANEIPSGFKLLGLIKSLTMQIYESQKIEIYLIKIRAYLLNIRWSKQMGYSLHKLILRLNLFMQNLKNSAFYDIICQDFYSQIERLYIEAIQQNLKQNRVIESLSLITYCFDSMKRQFVALSQMLDYQQKKVYSIMQKKVQLFSLLFKLEHAARLSNKQLSSTTLTNSIFAKYQRIINRIPVPFDKENLVQRFETETNHLIQSKKQIMDTIIQNVAPSNRISILSSAFDKNESKRLSVRESINFIKEIDRKKSNSVCLNPIASGERRNTKVSRFQKENIQKVNSQNVMKQSGISQGDQSKESQIKSIQNNKAKSIFKQEKKQSKEKDIKIKSKTRANSLIEVKNFSLVLRADKENRQKLISLNPLTIKKGQKFDLRLDKREMLKKGIFINIQSKEQ